MADDASLKHFLAAAAPLRNGRSVQPLRMFELLSAMRLNSDDALVEPLHDAMAVSILALAAPGGRIAAIARYAFERLAIEIETRMPPAFADRRPCGDRVRHIHDRSVNGAPTRLRSGKKQVKVVF